MLSTRNMRGNYYYYYYCCYCYSLYIVWV